MRNVFLAPSDFAFLLDECPRCWWLKTKGVKRPGASLPRIFSQIDKGMKECMTVDVLKALGIPATKLVKRGFIRSQALPYEALEINLSTGGYADHLAELETGGTAVIEFKTAVASQNAVEKYARQIHAYAYCLENPDSGDPCEVTDLWMVFFDASLGSFKVGEKFNAAQTGLLIARKVDHDRTRFAAVLDSCAELAGQLNAPPASVDCETCRHFAELTRYLTEDARRKQLQSSGVSA